MKRGRTHTVEPTEEVNEGERYKFKDLFDEIFLHHIFPNCTSLDLSLLSKTCKKFSAFRRLYRRMNATAQQQSYLASRNGYINILEYLKDIGKLDLSYILSGVVGGHVSVLEWYESAVAPIPTSDWTILMERATMGGHLEMLQWLHRRFNVRFEEILCVFHVLKQTAAENNHIHVFKWLTSMGSSDDDWMPDWRAIAYNGAKEFIVWFVETDAPLSKIEKYDILDMAVAGSRVDLSKWALEQNATIATSAFSSAVVLGLLELVKLFKSHGFEIGQDFYAVDLCEIDWASCVSPASFDTVKWCIEQGYYRRRTIPPNFIKYGQTDIVNTLLAMGCKLE